MNRAERACVLVFYFLLAASGRAGAHPDPQDSSSTQTEEGSQATPEGGTWETVSATTTRFGDTGYFDVFSAYTLLKSKVSIAGFRDNIDRDFFNLDISNFAGTVAVGVSDRVEVFGRFDVLVAMVGPLDLGSLQAAVGGLVPAPEPRRQMGLHMPRVRDAGGRLDVGFGVVPAQGRPLELLVEMHHLVRGTRVQGIHAQERLVEGHRRIRSAK